MESTLRRIKTKVLIVDDNIQNILALSELITRDDIEIFSATNAEDALARLLDHDFSLAMLDVEMPDMDGFELAQLIRGVQRTSHLPIIFVTAHEQDHHTIFKGYESGAVDFLFKPLDGRIVRSKVNTFVEMDKRNKLIRIKMEEIEVLRRNAEQANLSKSQFLANMSHEIRTPLAAVLGFSDVLSDSNLSDADRLESISAIRRNGELLSRLIDDILDLSKIEAQQLHFIKNNFSLRELLRDVENSLLLKANEKGIALLFELPPELNTHYFGDLIRIKQILLNVIGNAIKFTDQGMVEVSLKIEANPGIANCDILTFTVKDTGIGIKPKDISKLFQPFGQADNSSKKRFAGTGLGLTISRELCRALGGDLVLVSSEYNEGSIFEIKIKLKQSEIQSLNSGAHEIVIQPLTSEMVENLTGKKILVVDDVADNRLLIERYLNGTHSIVYEAANGLEAIKLTKEKKPDIILLDIQMPIMDGYETVRHIRKNGYNKPVIALTAHAMKDELQKCLEAGCDKVLTKPAKRRDLISSLSYALQNSPE